MHLQSRLLLCLLATLLCSCRGNSNSGTGPDSGTYNLEAISPFPGVPDWSMAGRGPAHSGYVPVTLHSSTFSARWSVDLGSGCQEALAYSCTSFSSVVTDSADGHVIMVSNEAVQSANVDTNYVTLYALNESDGSIAWKVSSFPADDDNEDMHSNEYSDPSISEGRVYMASYVEIGQAILYPQEPPVLAAFDAKTGARIFSVNAPCANPCSNGAYIVTQPVVADSIMYTGAPLSAFDAASGTLLWSATLGGVGQSIGSQGLYLSRGTGDVSSPAFVALDRASGSTLFQILPAANEAGLAGVIPVLDGMGGAVVGEFDTRPPSLPSATGFLDHYSLATRTRDWEAQGYFDNGSVPVVAGGIVYACDGDDIDAYDVSDGTKQWHWTPTGDTTLVTSANSANNCSLAVTNNLLFVSSGQATYAVDLSTHQSVWSYPKGGRISISPSGILYISANHPSPAHLVAINLH